MNYQKIYDQICKRAKSEVDYRVKRKKSGEVYYEGHHILPYCLGGTGKSWNYDHPNICILTAREHFICHWLLTKIYKDNSLIISAFWLMCNKGKKRSYYVSSRTYQHAKELFSEHVSKILTGRIVTDITKNKISKKNKGSKRTDDQKQKMRDSQKDKIGDRNSFYGKTHSLESKQKMRDKKLGSKASLETKLKMSNIRLGKHLSEQAKQKMRKPREKIKCPHCDKIGGNNLMHRYHFDNCKQNKKNSH